MNQRNREYRAENPDLLAAQGAAYRSRHREQIAAYLHQWGQENRDRKRETNRRWRERQRAEAK
ncbi:hypothetical protein [Streptomyces sp. W007]|uniref:hypothetical protein n=1 Tax=Streptomyces sp. W007 TaxID=1055352 RepID=UPI000307B620|nr:hypothetical protein [Streptomyces sp. W007]